MRGFARLTTAADLREKLRRDLERWRAHPLDADLAFNFFVTANALPDWLYPNSKKSKHEREGNSLLKVCAHLADSAKHLELSNRARNDVTSAGPTAGFFPPQFFPPRFFGRRFFGGGQLVVQLDGPAATELGTRVGALELAEKIMAFWDAHSDLPSRPED